MRLWTTTVYVKEQHATNYILRMSITQWNRVKYKIIYKFIFAAIKSEIIEIQ